MGLLVSDLETTVWIVLWVLVLVIVALVALLYRQLEKVYATDSPAQSTLPTGAAAQPIEVADDGHIVSQTFNAKTQLFAFVSTTCSTCLDFVREFRRYAETGNGLMLVIGEKTPEFARALGDTTASWVAHPPDVERVYGLTGYPTVYLVEDGIVAGVSTRGTAADLDALWRHRKAGRRHHQIS